MPGVLEMTGKPQSPDAAHSPDHEEPHLQKRGSMTQFYAHMRPSLTALYSPSPAPGGFIHGMVHHDDEGAVDPLAGSTKDIKGLLKPPGTPGTGRRVGLPVELIGFINSPGPNAGGDPLKAKTMRLKETPRTQWRNQYWSKNTPWGTDRKLFGGSGMYKTPVKPSARNYNASGRWELEQVLPSASNSEDIVRQICAKLEQHCNSTFALTKAFKLFDRDNSSTIDVEEMRAVLITFSIELSDDEISRVMLDFGGQDSGDGKGLQIRYAQFVKAVDELANQHPLLTSTGRYLRDLRVRYTRDEEGRRLCTPGFKAPVGCPIAGCVYSFD